VDRTEVHAQPLLPDDLREDAEQVAAETDAPFPRADDHAAERERVDVQEDGARTGVSPQDRAEPEEALLVPARGDDDVEGCAPAIDQLGEGRGLLEEDLRLLLLAGRQPPLKQERPVGVEAGAVAAEGVAERDALHRPREVLEGDEGHRVPFLVRGDLQRHRDAAEGHRRAVLQLRQPVGRDGAGAPEQFPVLVERMGRDEEAERPLLAAQRLLQVPGGNLGEGGMRGRPGFRAAAGAGAAEERALPHLPFPPPAHPPLERGREPFEERRARGAEAVHGPRVDQRLDALAVDRSAVDPLAEIVERDEGAGRARLHHRLHGVVADPLHRAEAEADRSVVHGEGLGREVDVRRAHADPEPPALREQDHDAVGVRHLRGERRRHELDRVVHLQVGRLVGHDRVPRRVRLVEAVPREVGHQVEDLRRRRLGDRPGEGALDEAGALLVHDLLLLLPHRAAEQVGLAQRVARQGGGDLHDLLLVDDDPVGLLQDRLQERVLVLDRPVAVLPLDEVLDHPGAERARAVEGVHRDEVLERLRVELAQVLRHAGGLELEDADRVAPAEEGVGLGVVEGEGVEVEAHAARREHLQAVLQDRQRAQAEKVHLEQPDLLAGAHVELRRDFPFARPVERNIVGERRRGDHDPGGVRRGVPREPLEDARDRD